MTQFLARAIFRYFCKKDNKRLAKLMQTPEDIERKVNISYGKHGKWNLLDVYYPKDTNKPLPTIVNIHGGGYVYGTKEEAQRKAFEHIGDNIKWNVVTDVADFQRDLENLAGKND